MLIKNKKADLTVVLLVFLVLFLAIATLFTFYKNSNGVNTDSFDYGISSRAIIESNSVQFSLNEMAKKATLESYKTFIPNGEFVDKPTFDLDFNVKFEALNPSIESEFSEEFKENLKKEAKKINSNEALSASLKELFEKGTFIYSFDGDTASVFLKEINLKISSGNTNVSYFPELNSKINLGQIGLESFEDVYRAKESCKNLLSSNLMESCFEQELSNFDAIVSEKQSASGVKTFVVELSSRKLFFEDGKLEPLKFKFIPI